MASQTFQIYIDTIGRPEVICLHPKTSFDDVLLFADVLFVSSYILTLYLIDDLLLIC